jgi:hypothetical protein
MPISHFSDVLIIGSFSCATPCFTNRADSGVNPRFDRDISFTSHIKVTNNLHSYLTAFPTECQQTEYHLNVGIVLLGE